jgi:hypothetical protein
MRRWLSSVDWTTKRVFIITWLAAMVAVGMLFLADLLPQPLPSRVADAIWVALMVWGAPIKACLDVYAIIIETLRGPIGHLDVGGDPFSICLMLSANALLWATLVTVAYVLILRLRNRRAATKEV